MRPPPSSTCSASSYCTAAIPSPGATWIGQWSRARTVSVGPRTKLNCVVSPSVSANAAGPSPTTRVSFPPKTCASVSNLTASALGWHGGGASPNAESTITHTTSSQLSTSRPACRALAAAMLKTGAKSGTHATPRRRASEKDAACEHRACVTSGTCTTAYSGTFSARCSDCAKFASSTG